MFSTPVASLWSDDRAGAGSHVAGGIQHPEAAALRQQATPRATVGADLVPSPPAGTVPIERHDDRSPQSVTRGPDSASREPAAAGSSLSTEAALSPQGIAAI
jgi:hypothetical protein